MVACVFMGAFVFFRSPRSLVNRLYLLMSSCFAFQCMIEFGYFQSQNFEQASFWWHMDVLWYVDLPATFYIVIALSGKEHLLKRVATHLFILLPALIFLVLDIGANSITNPPIEHEWGWSYGGLKDTIVADMSLIWNMLIWGTAVGMLVHQCVSERDPFRRKRAKILIIAMLISYSSVLMDIVKINELFNIEIVGTFSPTVTLTNGVIAYAIWKYELFALTPITVAENIVASISDTMLLVNNAGKIESCNHAGLKTLEYTEKELINKSVEYILDAVAERPKWMTGQPASREEEEIKYIDTRLKSKNGKSLPVSLSSSVLIDANGHNIGYLLIARDIEERNRREQELKVYKNHLEKLVAKRTEELENSLKSLREEADRREHIERERVTLEKERESLEEQLIQAQKLESIGRLAGGVAHDFNNLLFVINAYSEGFVNQLKEDDPLFNDFREIHQAAERATSLTQQLLAFSRKQITTPTLVDPNASIRELHKMLSRIIGENIRFNIIPCLNVGHIKIDSHQLDQILINLAVNARDAITGSGTITVEAKHVSITEEECRNRDGARPGAYVLIEFSDDGSGMDEKTMKRIFDPFFTTKGPGKGTGLGLSTIYGIVKQNGGFIEVDSAIGEGSTFRVYFPKFEPDIMPELFPMDFIAPKGDETILLVEDDNQVRRLAARLLRQLGYTVHEASGAGDAARIFHELREQIDLLFTDIIMPGMNGKQLSKLLGMGHPRMKILFMSGYNEEIIDSLGRLDLTTNFIAKPFSPGDLSIKIREVLDA